MLLVENMEKIKSSEKTRKNTGDLHPCVAAKAESSANPIICSSLDRGSYRNFMAKQLKQKKTTEIHASVSIVRFLHVQEKNLLY